MPEGHEIAMALRTAYLTMHRHANLAFEPGEITADQFVVLHALAEFDSSTQQELALRTSCDANTLRAMLLLLEKRELVIRSPHPTDRRARRVSLTDLGKLKVGTALSSSERFRTRLKNVLPPSEAETLVALLIRITDTMCSKKDIDSGICK